MNKRMGEILEKRGLEKSYFSIYCISTKIGLDSDKGYRDQKKIYTFFGCTLDGKKKYISSILETDVEKTSDWYNFFQGLKNRGVEHIIFALLPRKREIKDAIKLSFPKVEIFVSCENTIEKLQKYSSYKIKFIKLNFFVIVYINCLFVDHIYIYFLTKNSLYFK